MGVELRTEEEEEEEEEEEVQRELVQMVCAAHFVLGAVLSLLFPPAPLHRWGSQCIEDLCSLLMLHRSRRQTHTCVLSPDST